MFIDASNYIQTFSIQISFARQYNFYIEWNRPLCLYIFTFKKILPFLHNFSEEQIANSLNELVAS
jgi:hypothetical protein